MEAGVVSFCSTLQAFSILHMALRKHSRIINV
jgi:hypothetical protein